MDIRDLLMTDLMIMDLKATTKNEVIDEMVHNLFVKGIIDDEVLAINDTKLLEKYRPIPGTLLARKPLI